MITRQWPDQRKQPQNLNSANSADSAETDTTVQLESDRAMTVPPRGLRVAAASPSTVVPERHLYRVREAMILLSVSRSVLYEQIRAGRLRTVTIGRSRLVPADAINSYVQLLIDESEVPDDEAA